MPLSRLDNFLKNVRGNIIYVDPNDLDATDDIDNQGNSRSRPFRTIQRALIEASRFSYQRGLDNDRFGKTTILLMPGDHLIDNRPGWIPLSASSYQLRNGETSSDFPAFTSSTDFDLTSNNNILYKLNSVYGGVIVPRGTSIVGQDLRKTKIRPLYVPDPENANIEASAFFRVTGACYFNSFTIFDGNINSTVYKNYGIDRFVPNFSHHKLVAFEYADGVNDVFIDDSFISSTDYGRTDLDIYYEKIGLAYGSASGRGIEPDYPSSGLDIQPKIDEYRIVGPEAGTAGISSIRAGDGVTPTTTITVELEGSNGLEGLNVDTAFQVNNVNDEAYNGSFVVTSVTGLSPNTGFAKTFTYSVPTAPTDPLENPTSATVELDTDTVTSASPYIFNISLRSVYGLCGIHADGSKATGFKSMVLAQFTGVSLQKDDNAFVKYDESSGSFLDSTSVTNIHSDGDASYKPEYYNFHVKASNNSVMQLVSIFAIGYAQHFVTESGGDFSVTNSNSNFGETALVSRGFRDDAFGQDDVGYISHIIPPEYINSSNFNLEFDAIDIAAGIGSTDRLYLYNQTNQSIPPQNVIQGYRIGAKVNDELKVGIATLGQYVEYKSRIVMPNTSRDVDQISSVKVKKVGRTSTGINSITSNTITLTDNHQFINGESIRILSENARLPDGLEDNKIYFAITNGLNDDQIRIASSLGDAIDGSAITINNLGGQLRVESRVSDKISGNIGHPIQYDTNKSQWYINVGSASTDNGIYEKIVGLGTTALGNATSRTYITRNSDPRSNDDKIYKLRYVIPSGVGITSARPPRVSYIIQDSSDVSGSTNSEVALQFNPNVVTMNNSTQMRNFKFIRTATSDASNITFTSELPHNLKVGSKVKVNNVTSTNNTLGVGNSGFNSTYTVTSILSSTEFVVNKGSQNPGTFNNNTSLRNTSLPNFQTKTLPRNSSIYNFDIVREYRNGSQNGVYYLTSIGANETPTVSPFNDEDKFKFKLPIKNLYPQYDRDNPSSDPDSVSAYALPGILGSVVIDNVKKSVTKKTIQSLRESFSVGFGITDMVSNSTGTSHTVFTDVEHDLNRIVSLEITNAGSGYGNGTGGNENLYNAVLQPVGSGVTGGQATARITVNGSGSLTAIDLMNPGSNYKVGDNLNVVGVATTTSFSVASVAVTSIYNNIGDTVKISGVTSTSYNTYNTLYKISGISSTNEIQLDSLETILNASTDGVGASNLEDAVAFVTGPTVGVSSIKYDNVTGLATVTTSDATGYRVGKHVRISGSTESFYNNTFSIVDVTDINNFIIDAGKRTDKPNVGGTIEAHDPGLTAASGEISLNDENFKGRQFEIYKNLTATLSSQVASESIDEINIDNINDFDLKIGDYVLIGEEIMRIKTTVTTNPVKVFRGLLDTPPSTHLTGSVVKRIHIQPIELRRTSITRASGHTFEYIGYGPGNYSTALPSKQNRQRTIDEQVLAQSSESGGGVNVFTGMNDRGDFFVGNKKISSNTGQEDVFSTPVPTVTGEDIFSLGSDISIDVLNPVDITIDRTIKVEGGTSQQLLSQFNGPVLFTKKITSTAPGGIEANNLFIQGNANVSRRLTVGISTPVLAGTPGDIIFDAFPSTENSLRSRVGWIYTVQNSWHQFGAVSILPNSNTVIFDAVGVGTTTPVNDLVRIGSGTTSVHISNDGVGIGTSANNQALRVIGGVTADVFTGDGSGLFNISNDSLWLDYNSAIVPLDNKNVGVGTTQPTNLYSLEVGSVGVSKTDLYVVNESRFIGTMDAGDINSSGRLTNNNYDLQSTDGTITAGIITSTNIKVGGGATIISTSNIGVGIGSTQPREMLDVNGRARIQTYYELPKTVLSIGNVVELDLSEGQTFLHTTTQNINQFKIINPVNSSTAAFTLKITQGSTSRNVGIDTFVNASAVNIPVYWPGGVVPVVTNAGNATDIYSFITFDGGASLYGVVGGQNFS